MGSGRLARNQAVATQNTAWYNGSMAEYPVCDAESHPLSTQFYSFLIQATSGNDQRTVDAARYVLQRWPRSIVNPSVTGRILRAERSIHSAALDRLLDEFVASGLNDEQAVEVRGSVTPLTSPLDSHCRHIEGGTPCGALAYGGTMFCISHQQLSSTDADRMRIGLAVSLVDASLEAITTLIDVMRTSPKAKERTDAAAAVLRAAGVDGATVLNALSSADDNDRAMSDSPLEIVETRLAALRTE